MAVYKHYIKVKLSHYRHENSKGERKYSAYLFLTLAVPEVTSQHHKPFALYPQGKDPISHCIGGWVGLRAGLDSETRGKNSLPLPGMELSRPVCSQTLYWLSYLSCHQTLHAVKNLTVLKFCDVFIFAVETDIQISHVRTELKRMTAWYCVSSCNLHPKDEIKYFNGSVRWFNAVVSLVLYDMRLSSLKVFITYCS
jgi:hypothetical protein